MVLLWIMFIMILSVYPRQIKARGCRRVESVSAFLPSSNRRRNRAQHSSYLYSSPSSSSTATTTLSSMPIREEIRYIAGRRALILHPSNDNRNNNIQHPPPLVVLSGMAQSISSWEFHLPYLAKQRSVLIYEGIGQGPLPPHIITELQQQQQQQQQHASIEEYYENVTLERQGHDFWKVVDEAFFDPGCYYYNNKNHIINSTTKKKSEMVVDVACFSFGSRVALAAATIQSRIRRMHLTGVGAERDDLANIHIESWKEMLGCTSPITVCDEMKVERDNSRLRSFAWSIILATYSEKFLISAGPDRIKTWVDGVCQYNTEEGLRAILMQTHDNNGEWSPASMAQRIQQQSSNKSELSIESCRIVVGSEDKMANPNQAYQLAKILSRNTKNKEEDDDDSIYKVIEGCGHAVPMEAMRLWREDVLQYLNR